VPYRKFGWILTLFIGLPSIAAEVDHVSLSSTISYGYGSEIGTSMHRSIELVPTLDLSLNKSVSLVTSARVWLDAGDELEPGEPTRLTYSPGSRPLSIGDSGSGEIRDFFLEIRFRNGLARFGKQPIVWGQLDGIKVLDLINPQDFREFILDDFADSRISLWSAYIDISLGEWRGELAIVPDSSGHAIPDTGAWFELTAPRFRYGAESASSRLPLVTVQPSHSINTLATGLRLSREIGSMNVSMVAYSGMDPAWLGRIRSVEGQPSVERFQERRKAFGFSLEKNMGAAVLRAEYAFQPDRVFNSRDATGLVTNSLDQHRGAIALDVDGPLGVFINMQYLIDSISAAPTELVRPSTDRIATLYLRKALAYDTLLLEARWYRSLTEDDQLFSLGVDYIMNDSTSIELAAQHFSGVQQGLFGQFADRDRIVISLVHTF
jgi:hypothetical protein